LEFYQAYSDYEAMAELTRSVIQEVAQTVCGTQVVTWVDGTEYDLSGTWPTVPMYGSLSEALESEITPQTSVEELHKHADALGLPIDPAHGHGKLVERLWEHLVGDHLSAPTFVRDFPVETSPLTRQHRTEPGLAEKWDLYVAGFELATGPVDEDFLRALEYGMPPSGGVGMGIDRLLMVLTGLGIRETILFPLVRPE
jgi:lysyl-tRNA synthetase class 2